MKIIENKRGWILWIIAVIFLIYLAIDIIHFFDVRFKAEYEEVYIEAVFESYIISFMKWGLCVLCILAILCFPRIKGYTIYLLLFSSILILCTFLLKGQFSTPMIGSLAFNFGLLELNSLVALIYSLAYIIKYLGLMSIKTIVTVGVSLAVYLFIINPMPNFIMI